MLRTCRLNRCLGRRLQPLAQRLAVGTTMLSVASFSQCRDLVDVRFSIDLLDVLTYISLISGNLPPDSTIVL